MDQREKVCEGRAFRSGGGFADAKRFLAQHGVRGQNILWYWKGDFYTFEGDRYVERDRDHVEHLVHMWLAHEGDNPRFAYTQEVVHGLKALVMLDPVEVEMPAWLGEGGSAPEDWVALGNGMLHLGDWERMGGRVPLRPHTPAWFSTVCRSVEYAPEAACPKWKRFMGEVFDGDPERTALCQEWFGYCVTHDLTQQKILLVEGVPGSGKSTLTNILGYLVGHENCAFPRLTALAGKFAMQGLVGKSVAICPDAHVPVEGRGNILELIKTIAGGDYLTIERKYKTSVECRLGIRLTLVVNELPRFPDTPVSLDRRLLVLSMNRSFSDAPDRELEDKLHAELPGILNWALDGLVRLRRQGCFTEPCSSVAVKEELAHLGSPVKEFVDTECKTGSKYQVSTRMVWDRWVTWCALYGYPVTTMRRFSSQLRSVIPSLDRDRVHVSGSGDNRKRGYFFKGLTLKHQRTSWRNSDS